MSIKEQDPKGTQQQESPSPVPLEKHYEVFQEFQSKIHIHLGGLDHEYFPIGLRLAYDEADSSGEPGDMPYKMEFGYLGPLDVVAECTEQERLTEEEIQAAFKNSPIPLEFLEELREDSRKALEEAAGTPLIVGVFIVLLGSPIRVFADYCCANRKNKVCITDPVTKKPRCYCGNKNC
jgi:hypothetical protein